MNIKPIDGGWEIDIGGAWEETAFEIQLNREVGRFSDDSGVEPCPHCSPKQTRTHTRSDGGTYNEEFWFIPRVVVAVNEGGCCSTGVCLDCILDAAKQIEHMEPDAQLNAT